MVVITSGIARKPGMSRDDLLLTNMKIVTSVVKETAKYSPDAVHVIVTNPLDAMAQQALKVSGLNPGKVFGMAGILDTARYRTFISQELNVSVDSVSAYVLGGHGDRGAEIVNYLKTGSAFYAPSASITQMVEAILLDKKEILPCTAYLEGQYGIEGLYVGVPVKLGANGIEEIIELELNNDELAALQKSADAVRELIEVMAKS